MAGVAAQAVLKFQANRLATRVGGALGGGGSKDDIAWDAYNWPFSGLGLIHFDLKELKGGARMPVLVAYVEMLAILVALVFNFISNIVLAILVPSTWQGAAFAFLNIVLGIIFSFYGIFLSFRSIALDERSFIYLGVQGVAVIVSICYVLLGATFFHGLFSLTSSTPHGTTGIDLYWTITVWTESIIWMCIAALGVVAIISSLRYWNRSQGSEPESRA